MPNIFIESTKEIRAEDVIGFDGALDLTTTTGQEMTASEILNYIEGEVSRASLQNDQDVYISLAAHGGMDGKFQIANEQSKYPAEFVKEIDAKLNMQKVAKKLTFFERLRKAILPKSSIEPSLDAEKPRRNINLDLYSCHMGIDIRSSNKVPYLKSIYAKKLPKGSSVIINNGNKITTSNIDNYGMKRLQNINSKLVSVGIEPNVFEKFALKIFISPSTAKLVYKNKKGVLKIYKFSAIRPQSADDLAPDKIRIFIYNQIKAFFDWYKKEIPELYQEDARKAFLNISANYLKSSESDDHIISYGNIGLCIESCRDKVKYVRHYLGAGYEFSSSLEQNALTRKANALESLILYSSHSTKGKDLFFDELKKIDPTLVIIIEFVMHAIKRDSGRDESYKKILIFFLNNLTIDNANNSKTRLGEKSLFESAITLLNVEVIDHLLSLQGFDINHVNEEGQHPLMFAIDNKDYDTALKLLKRDDLILKESHVKYIARNLNKECRLSHLANNSNSLEFKDKTFLQLTKKFIDLVKFNLKKHDSGPISELTNSLERSCELLKSGTSLTLSRPNRASNAQGRILAPLNTSGSTY